MYSSVLMWVTPPSPLQIDFSAHYSLASSLIFYSVQPSQFPFLVFHGQDNRRSGRYISWQRNLLPKQPIPVTQRHSPTYHLSPAKVSLAPRRVIPRCRVPMEEHLGLDDVFQKGRRLVIKSLRSPNPLSNSWCNWVNLASNRAKLESNSCWKWMDLASISLIVRSKSLFFEGGGGGGW